MAALSAALVPLLSLAVVAQGLLPSITRSIQLFEPPFYLPFQNAPHVLRCPYLEASSLVRVQRSRIVMHCQTRQIN